MHAPNLNSAALQLEKEWHDRLFASSPAASTVPSAVLERYTRPQFGSLFHLERMVEMIGDVRSKRILCYGCGDSNIPAILALRGADVWAIDISSEAITAQNRMAAVNGVVGKVTALVAPAEALPFENSFFDVVFGSMILHHLPDALDLAAKEVHRVLKQDGLAVFGEPITRSRILMWLRKLFPERDVSPRERQLTDADFAAFRARFALTVEDYYILSRFDRFILHAPLESAPPVKRAAVLSLAKLDRALLQIRGLRRLASTAVVSMRPTSS